MGRGGRPEQLPFQLSTAYSALNSKGSWFQVRCLIRVHSSERRPPPDPVALTLTIFPITGNKNVPREAAQAGPG